MISAAAPPKVGGWARWASAGYLLHARKLCVACRKVDAWCSKTPPFRGNCRAVISCRRCRAALLARAEVPSRPPHGDRAVSFLCVGSCPECQHGAGHHFDGVPARNRIKDDCRHGFAARWGICCAAKARRRSRGRWGSANTRSTNTWVSFIVTSTCAAGQN